MKTVKQLFDSDWDPYSRDHICATVLCFFKSAQMPVTRKMAKDVYAIIDKHPKRKALLIELQNHVASILTPHMDKIKLPAIWRGLTWMDVEKYLTIATSKMK
jgi:hypothetical protein